MMAILVDDVTALFQYFPNFIREKWLLLVFFPNVPIVFPECIFNLCFIFKDGAIFKFYAPDVVTPLPHSDH